MRYGTRSLAAVGGLSLLLAGNLAAQDATPTPTSAEVPKVRTTRIDIRDGQAYCVFENSGNQFAVGKVSGDNVTLFATYGEGGYGNTLSLKEIQASTAKVLVVEKGKPKQDEQYAVVTALNSRDLPGIWKAEKADGQTKSAAKDELYLVLRADRTFRFVKPGIAPKGTWDRDSKRRLVLKITEEHSIIAEVTRPDPNKLELKIVEGTEPAVVRYSRTNLTTEPKAPDDVPLAAASRSPATPKAADATLTEAPKAPATSPSTKPGEEDAQQALKLARNLMSKPTTSAAGKKRLQEIIDKWPETEAAAQAAKLLGTKPK